jgi:hypothetical protein
MATHSEDDIWITRVEAARRLGVNPHAITRLVGNGHLTVKALPDTHPKILAADVDKLMVSAVRPAIDSAGYRPYRPYTPRVTSNFAEH